MKILSFDVSTTATGCVIYDQETKKHISKLFKAHNSIAYERIRKIAKDVREWIFDKDFDMVLITKASYATMNANIVQLEGILLGIAVEKDIPFDYFGDSSWYSLISKDKDERPTKKKRSVERYVNENNLRVLSQEIKYVGKKLDKISVVVNNKDDLNSLPITITDDITDAWNAANLFEKRQERDKLRFEKKETQKQLNQLRVKKKKLGNSIKILESKIRLNNSEKDNFNKEFKLTGSKSKENSFMKRVNREVSLNSEIDEIKTTIKNINNQIKKLMDKKNNL